MTPEETQEHIDNALRQAFRIDPATQDVHPPDELLADLRDELLPEDMAAGLLSHILACGECMTRWSECHLAQNDAVEETMALEEDEAPTMAIVETIPVATQEVTIAEVTISSPEDDTIEAIPTPSGFHRTDWPLWMLSTLSLLVLLMAGPIERYMYPVTPGGISAPIASPGYRTKGARDKGKLKAAPLLRIAAVQSGHASQSLQTNAKVSRQRQLLITFTPAAEGGYIYLLRAAPRTIEDIEFLYPFSFKQPHTASPSGTQVVLKQGNTPLLYPLADETTQLVLIALQTPTPLTAHQRKLITDSPNDWLSLRNTLQRKEFPTILVEMLSLRLPQK